MVSYTKEKNAILFTHPPVVSLFSVLVNGSVKYMFGSNSDGLTDILFKILILPCCCRGRQVVVIKNVVLYLWCLNFQIFPWLACVGLA